MASDEVTVLQLVGDTKQFERSIRSVLGITKGATSDMVAAFERAGASMDGAGGKASKLQKQIEALTGVNSGMKDRAGDIAAYGAELDRLSAKYKPLFSAQQQYKKSLEEINQAARGGVLSEKERVAALDKTKAAFVAQVKGIRGVSEANTEIEKTGGLARHEMINLSRQIQDVGVSLFSGQSPLTVLAQQGAQIGDIFGSSKTGTVGGALKQIGSGIASVITPMRLLGVATVATGALALASLASWKSYTLQLDDTASSVGTTAKDLSKLQAAASFKGISADDFTKGIEQFGKGVYDAKNNMGGLAEVFRANNVHASSFDDALGKAADLIKNARDNQQRLVLLQQMGLPATMQWVRLLSGGADGLKAAKDAALDFGDAADDSMIKKAREFDEAWNKTTTNFALSWRSATVTVGGFLRDLVNSAPKIGAFNYQPSQQVKNGLLASGQGSTLGASSSVDRFYSGLGSSAPGNSSSQSNGAVDKEALKDRISKGQQYLGLLGQTTTATEARRQVELQLAAAALNGVGIDAKRAEVLKRLAEENILGITAMKQQADSLKVEAGAIGMSTGQAVAYTAAQNALNDARRNGRALTDENIAQINKEAAALGAAAQAAANAQIARQINMGRQTAFLSSDDVSIAQTLAAKYGDDVPKALASSDAAALRLNKTFSDIAQSMQSGLVTGLADILDGTKSASQGFADLGKSIIRMLEEAAIKAAIVQPLMSALGLGGGVIGSLIPKFASGTNYAPGGLSLVGERGPELVNLPRGSQVIPNHELRGGGSTTTISYSIDARGADSGTVARIQTVLAQHAKAIAGQGRAMQSEKRMQTSGVG